MEKEIINVAVLGSGSWATALVKIISEHPGVKIHWYVRKEENCDYIKKYRHNPNYLSAVEIKPEVVFPVSDIQACIDASEIVIIAIPSAFLSGTLEKASLPSDRIYVSAVKGIDPKNKLVIARYLESQFSIPGDNIGLITGPCHAEEVALEKLSYLTVSAMQTELAMRLESLISCRFIKTCVNNDLYGAEYAAVLKNIYAIGAGIAHGLGYGDNFQAVYVGAALREMEKFLDEIHETHRDVKNAAYLGDLLVTCYSQFSRNRTFGNMLGKGYSVSSAQLEMNMVAEGYYAVEPIHTICEERKIELPIVKAVYNVIHNHNPAKSVFQDLAGLLN